MFGWITDAILGASSLGYEISKDQKLTGAQREANEFTRQQAEAQMAFQSREAQMARQWQEDFYNQYQSPEAMMRQYQSAGLNPALMYGGAGSPSSPPSTGIPSGAGGSSVTPQGSSNIVEAFARLASLAAQIDNVKADTDQKRSETRMQEIQNYIAENTKDVTIQQATANLNLTNNEINKIAGEIQELGFQVSTQDVRRALMVADNVLKQSQVNHLDSQTAINILNRKFQDNLFGIPIPVVAALIVGGTNILGQIVTKIPFKKPEVKPLRTGSITRGPKGTTTTTYTYE